MKCQKHRTDGQPCGGNAINGRDACPAHVGEKLDKAKAKGAIVVALRRWGVDDLPEEPNLLALKLMSVTEWRRQDYEAEMLRIAAESGLPLSEAIVGDSIVIDKDGSPHKVGEYIRGIVDQEFRERKLAADLAFKVLAAGVQERMTRLAEGHAALVADAIRAVLTDLGHELTDPAVMRILSTRLSALAVA